MPQDVKERKLNRHFELLDLNSDGYIEHDDIMMFADRICEAAGVKPNAPQSEAFRQTGDNLWQALQKALDSDGDKRISRQEFVGSENLDAVMTEAIRLGVASFDVTDTDGDGRISREEWIRMDQRIGVARADSEKGFRQLDQDGDGYVTKEEYSRGVEEFYRSSDPTAPGNLAFGKF